MRTSIIAVLIISFFIGAALAAIASISGELPAPLQPQPIYAVIEDIPDHPPMASEDQGVLAMIPDSCREIRDRALAESDRVKEITKQQIEQLETSVKEKSDRIEQAALATCQNRESPAKKEAETSLANKQGF